jgi:hypothetical protein
MQTCRRPTLKLTISGCSGRDCHRVHEGALQVLVLALKAGLSEIPRTLRPEGILEQPLRLERFVAAPCSTKGCAWFVVVVVESRWGEPKGSKVAAEVRRRWRS